VRRLVTEAAAYLAGLARSSIEGWDAFFFRPADPTALGLIRLLVGVLAFWSMLVYGYDLRAHFGSTGWTDAATVQEVYSKIYPYQWSLWFHIPDAWIVPAWLACLVVLAMFAAGLFSRVTAVLAWIVFVSTARRLPISVFGFDQHISTWLLYLAATGASGQAVSLDRFLGRWRRARAEAARRRRDGRWATPSGIPTPTTSANLALRLIQLHLCLVYGTAGLAKLQGIAWWNGTAIWGTLAAGEFRLFDLTWLAGFPYLLNLMTHAGLALEILYPVLVWIRPIRPLVLALVVAMHLGIELTLGLGEFAAAMLAANLAFVPGSWLRGFAVAPESPPLKVLFDGACPRCRATAALVIAADPGGAIEPIDLTAVDVRAIHPDLTAEGCLRAMHVVSGAGAVAAGFDAVRWIGGRLPLFWPSAAIASLPGVASLGRVVYNRIAAARPRDVPCTDQGCGIHPGTPRSVPRLLRGHAPTDHNPSTLPADSQEVPRP
jgi:predicted DCC family thiol-disulfide oxidoreductase YuxK